MSKYVDITSITQVVGGIYLNPNLLDCDDKYFFKEEDFVEDFHKVVFCTIYNLFQLGASEISIKTINDYLEQKPKSLAIYKNNKGDEYLDKISNYCQVSTFNYYYNRMKKMTLLRMYEKAGLDLRWLYDVDNILDIKKKQCQEEWFDNTTIEDMAEIIDHRITDIRMKYVDDIQSGATLAGEGLTELLVRLKDEPDVGCPLYGNMFNGITRGARLGRFYLRSAATGTGKTRSMIADACHLAYPKAYDSRTNTWKNNNTEERVLFITTEQEKEEIQTMILSFVADVNEEKILLGNYTDEEWERICIAVKTISQGVLMIETLHDFSLKDIENTIKKAVRENDIRYIFLDYIHTSMKILGEVSEKTGVKGLREDNILFMISTRLKDLCGQYGVFIMSATQLNNDYKATKIYDQSLLRGAKSIADKIDVGIIMLNVDNEDLKSLSCILSEKGYPAPNVKSSIYKNRGGRYSSIIVWSVADRGTCKINPIFATDFNYKLVEIEEFDIKIREGS